MIYIYENISMPGSHVYPDMKKNLAGRLGSPSQNDRGNRAETQDNVV